MQIENLFFNTVLGNEAIGDNLLVLSDAVGTGNSLRFGGGVPPRIDNKHIVGLRQIKSYASGFQRDKEGLYVFLLGEMGNFGRTVVGCSCQ